MTSQRAVMLFEPRITLEEVSFEKKEEGVLLIKLIYTIVRTNNRVIWFIRSI